MEVLLGGGGGGGAEVALLPERLQRRMRGFAVEEQRLDTALPRFQVLPDMRSHQPLSCPIGPMVGMSWFWYPQLEQIHPLYEVLQVKRELVLNYFKKKICRKRAKDLQVPRTAHGSAKFTSCSFRPTTTTSCRMPVQIVVTYSSASFCRTARKTNGARADQWC